MHGGTRLSGRVVRKLADRGIDPLVTVTRSSARHLYPDQLNGKVRVGPLTSSELQDVVEEESVSAILDVTHPFANRISENAITVTNRKDLPYLFLDRESILPDEHPLLTVASSWVDATDSLDGKGNVLLTIGTKHLEVFASEVEVDRLVVRVLPDPESLRQAQEIGIDRKNILAMWPPETAAFEEQLIRDYKIDTVVTKDSGPSGNLPEKWKACRETGTSLVVVDRPEVGYPEVTVDPDRAVEWGVNHAGS